MVRSAAQHVIGVVLGFLEDGSDMVVVDPVLDLIAGTPDCRDQMSFAEQAELVGDGRLAGADDQR
jgi:hypothetical protein